MNLLASNRRRLVSSLLLLFFILPTLLPIPTAHAQGGVALAGNFHLQEYTLPQGTELSHPSIYLVVFNHGDELMAVEMQTDAPFGVEVLLDETEFTLEPSSDRKLFITVKVTEDAAPGEYDLIITATSAPAGEVDGTGARLATASAQKASLVVTGDAARVKARVVTPDGFQIESQLRLFKVLEERLNDVSQTETGEMDVKVAPGTYLVVAYIAGRRLAEEEFEIAAGETRELELIVRTAYFEQFAIEENYVPDTDQLSFVRMVYTINNLAGPLDDVEVILRVILNGKFLEQVELMTFGRLEIGRTGGSYSYIPVTGWQRGDYTFKLDLNVEGEFYIESAEQKLSLAPTLAAPGGISLYWWILIGAAIIAIAAFLWFRRRREEEEEKPEEEVPPPAEEEAEEAPVEEAEEAPAEEVAEAPAEKAEEAPAEETAEAPAEEPTKVVEEELPPLLEEQVEAEDVPEGEIEEPPDAEWEEEASSQEEAEDVPEGEIEEPPDAEVKEEPPEQETGAETEEAPSQEEMPSEEEASSSEEVEEPTTEPSEEEDKPADQ